MGKVVMKAYDKYRLREVDGSFSKDMKPVKVSAKPKIMAEKYVALENKNKLKSGFFYVENEAATKKFIENKS